MFKSILTTILLAVLASGAAADVFYAKDTKSLSVTGPTTAYQIHQAATVMQNEEVVTVTLAGPGGDFYSGLRLGRLIREEGAVVVISENTICVSACAFAALGADRVIVDGELWFHAPYIRMAPTTLSILEISQNIGAGYIDMASYLISMGVPTSFARDLLSETTPSKFIVIDAGLQISRIRATEKLWGKAVYNYRYETAAS